MTACPTCGTPWGGRGRFCGTCGGPMDGVDETVGATSGYAEPDYAPPAPPAFVPTGPPTWDLGPPPAPPRDEAAAGLPLLEYWPVLVPGAIAVISGLWILLELVR